MTKLPDTFECNRLRAKITERQCKLNREGYRSRGINFPSVTSCQGCAGLGESAHVPAPIQEVSVKTKKIKCGREGCGYGVKKEGDFCKKHQEPVTIPVEKQQRGLDDGPMLPLKVRTGLSSITTDAPSGIGYDDENEKAAQAGGAVEVDRTPVCLGCNGPVAGYDLFCLACGGSPLDLQVQPVASTTQEQVAPSSVTRKGLAALVCPVPLRLPSPPGLHIPFSLDELFILAEQEVTVEHIRQFVVMGLEQKLRPVDNEDPLAKSRQGGGNG